MHVCMFVPTGNSCSAFTAGWTCGHRAVAALLLSCCRIQPLPVQHWLQHLSNTLVLKSCTQFTLRARHLNYLHYQHKETVKASIYKYPRGILGYWWEGRKTMIKLIVRCWWPTESMKTWLNKPFFFFFCFTLPVNILSKGISKTFIIWQVFIRWRDLSFVFKVSNWRNDLWEETG